MPIIIAIGEMCIIEQFLEISSSITLQCFVISLSTSITIHNGSLQILMNVQQVLTLANKTVTIRLDLMIAAAILVIPLTVILVLAMVRYNLTYKITQSLITVQ